MTRNEAIVYIGRVIGGANDPRVYDLSAEALTKSYSDWQTAKDWEGALKDTSLGFSVSGVTGTGATLTAPSTGAFDGINVGVTVTVDGANNSALVAGTTVTAYARATDGTISTITLSNAVTGATGAYALAIGGDIPLIAGTQDYNVPPDIYRPYSARHLIGVTAPIEFIRPRYWNRRTISPATAGVVEAYTIFNPKSALTQNRGTLRLRVYRIPAQNGTMRLEYYRRFDPLADPVDMDEQFLYKFLEYARAEVLKLKRAMDDPASFIKSASSNLQMAMTADEEITEDNDIRLISQMEVGDAQRPLWTNGAFNPDYGY